MKEKLILITGATDGIGKQTAMELAEKEYHVIMHGRNPKKSKNALNEIKNKTQNQNIDLVLGDFASLDEVRKLANQIHDNYSVIDVLINNAGLIRMERLFTKDGFEMTFGVNYLAPFFLTSRLMDLLAAPKQSRIVNVGALAYLKKIDFDNLQGEKRFEGWNAYCSSKSCNLLFTYELAERLENRNITVNCLHPGVIQTNLSPVMVKGFGTHSLSEGARTSIYLAISPEVEGITGKFFMDDQTEKRTSRMTHDNEVRKKLWSISEEFVGEKFIMP